MVPLAGLATETRRFLPGLRYEDITICGMGEGGAKMWYNTNKTERLTG